MPPETAVKNEMKKFIELYENAGGESSSDRTDAATSGLFVGSLPLPDGGTWRPAIKMRVGAKDQSTCQLWRNLLLGLKLLLNRLQLGVQVLFSQVGIPNTFIDPLNEF